MYTNTSESESRANKKKKKKNNIDRHWTTELRARFFCDTPDCTRAFFVAGSSWARDGLNRRPVFADVSTKSDRLFIVWLCKHCKQ